MAGKLTLVRGAAADLEAAVRRAVDGRDFDHRGERVLAVQHRARTVGDLDLPESFGRDARGIELAVRRGIERNAVDEQKHMAGAEAADVDARRAVPSGSDVDARKKLQGLIERPRVTSVDFGTIDPSRRPDRFDELVRFGDRHREGWPVLRCGAHR